MPDLILRSPIQFEPKLHNRFKLEFPSDVGIEAFAVKSVQAPSLNINTNELEFMNTSTYYNGRYNWNPISITLRDYIGPSTAQALMEWLRLYAESVTGRSGYHASHSKTMTLQILDPAGVSISEWLIENAILTGTVDFGGTFDYADDSIVEISFDIQPQRCILLY